MEPDILGLGTAVPRHCYQQADLYHLLVERTFGPNRRSQAIFRASQIRQRFSVLGDQDFYTRPRSTAERNRVYMAEAPALAEQAVRSCLAAARVQPQEVDDLIVVSCTGMDTPGLDLLLPRRLGMRASLRRTFIGAMGCCAAFPGLQRAVASVTARPGTLALVVSVELCSLHFQMEDSPENVLAAALFSDGSAAALIGQARDGRDSLRPRIRDLRTHTDYSTLEQMTFHLTDTGFKMVLAPTIPDVLCRHTGPLIDDMLHANGLERGAVRFWGIHPGGPKILSDLQQALGLDDQALRFSRKVLAEKGNMSSATVLIVLDEIASSGNPAPGDLGVLLAFGPGLTLEAALLQW